MKTLLASTILLTLFGSYLSSAQTGTIHGQVIDASSKEFIIGAIVSLPNNGQHSITDATGNYNFENVKLGTDSITVSFIGYDPFGILIHLHEGETLNLKQELKPSSFELHEIHVTAEPEQLSRVISDVDIHLRVTNTSQDILRIVPGLFLAQHAGGGKAEQIFLRGFDCDHGTDISITTDGMPVNMVSHAHGQGYADLHFLIPETVDRVLFGKGPYTMNYGNLATAGYVGFHTYNNLEDNILSFQVGQYNSQRVLGMIKLLDQHDGQASQNAYIAGEYNTTDGYFDKPQDFHRLNLFGKYNGSLGRANYLTVIGSTFSSNWDASGQIPERAVESGMIGSFGSIDSTEGGQTKRTNINIQLTSTLQNESWLKNQVYYSQYGFELYSNFTFFLNDNINGDQIKQKEHRNLFGYTGSYGREDQWLGFRWTSEAGLQFRHDFSKDSELSNTAQRTKLLKRLSFGDIEESNLGLYLNETIRFNDRLTLNTGIRWDYFNFGYADHLTNLDFRRVNAQIASPKINAYYQLTDQLQLSANLGYGFHSNDTRVVVQQEGMETLPKALGMDLGVLWKPVQNLIISASLWRLNLEQEFVYVGDEAVVEPSGRSQRKGIEFSGRLEIFKWLFADMDLNYTIARSRDEAEGMNYIPLAPKFSSVGGLSIITNKHWSGSIHYRSLGIRPANEDNSVVAEGYTVVDFLADYRIRNYEFGITIENILDTRWKEAQFDTESRLKGESAPVEEIHFTAGTPFNAKVHVTYHF